MSLRPRQAKRPVRGRAASRSRLDAVLDQGIRSTTVLVPGHVYADLAAARAAGVRGDPAAAMDYHELCPPPTASQAPATASPCAGQASSPFHSGLCRRAMTEAERQDIYENRRRGGLWMGVVGRGIVSICDCCCSSSAIATAKLDGVSASATASGAAWAATSAARAAATPDAAAAQLPPPGTPPSVPWPRVPTL